MTQRIPFSATRLPLLFAAALCGAGPVTSRAADPLKAGAVLPIPGTKGKYDFITVDTEGRRLLGAHTGNGSLDVVDIDKATVVKVVPTGAAQSCAVDAKGHVYYVSVSKPPQLVAVDAAKLEVTGKVPLPGPADLLAFNSKTGQPWVDHDDGKDLWIIDPVQKKIAVTVALPGEAPEDLAFDAEGARLFQAMKTGNVVAVVDTKTNKVTAKWPTAPVEGPHGMAVVAEYGGLLFAGSNGKLVMLSDKDGHVLASADIPKGVDQIAYDAALHQVYCASNTGKIAVLKVEKDKLTPAGEAATAPGVRSIALDAKTHTVWVAGEKGGTGFVQPFTPVR